MTELQYIDLKKRAIGIINRYNGIGMDAQSLIAETFIMYGYTNDDLFSKNMYILAGLSKTNKYDKNENKVSQDRVCKKCNEIYPSNYFRSWFLRGYLILDSYCRICKNKLVNDSKKRKRSVN